MILQVEFGGHIPSDADLIINTLIKENGVPLPLILMTEGKGGGGGGSLSFLSQPCQATQKGKLGNIFLLLMLILISGFFSGINCDTSDCNYQTALEVVCELTSQTAREIAYVISGTLRVGHVRRRE